MAVEIDYNCDLILVRVWPPIFTQMNNDEQILAALNKLSDLQEQALAIQRQAFESQQEAIANQQKAIKNQVATGRIYRISLVILALLIVAFLFWFFVLWR